MTPILVANARKLADVPAGYTLVYVGRNTSYKPEYGVDFSILGNPYTTRHYSREDAVALYRQWLTQRDSYGTPQGRALEQLRERLGEGEKLALVCWCAPLACHGDVIREQLEGK